MGTHYDTEMKKKQLIKEAQDEASNHQVYIEKKIHRVDSKMD